MWAFIAYMGMNAYTFMPIIGINAYMGTYYPPKESSLKELTEWVSLFGSAFTCVIPQRRVPKNSLSGSHWFEWLSSPCLINLKFDSPPTTHSKSTSLFPKGEVP